MFGVHDYLSKSYKAYALWHTHPRRSKHHFILFLIVAVGITFGMIDTTYEPSSLYANTHRPRVSVRTLTNQMLSTIHAYELTPRAEREHLFSIVLPIIEARNDALRTLARRDLARAALESLPPHLIYSFPPEIANLLEEDLNFFPPTPLDPPAKYSAAAAALATTECMPGATTATLSPLSYVAQTAGTAVTYTLTITNSDSVDCSTTDYTIATTPLEWISSSTPLVLTVPPGNTSATEIVVTSPANQPIGITTISAHIRGNNTLHDSETHATYISYPNHRASDTAVPQAPETGE